MIIETGPNTGTNSRPNIARSDLFGDIPHGFLGRQGGVSTGDFASLNVGLGSGEDRSLIEQNRAIARDSILPESALVGVYQVHGNRCVIVDAPLEERPEADAMATRTPGLLLGILTADCVPVLFADKQAGVVGAAHAGWKGALAGITDSTVAAMEELGANRDDIVCAIGPCIARASYEVDAGFYANFCAADPANERFFADGKPGHFQFDVEAYVVHRLAQAGVRRIEAMGIDTYARENEYYSYRRSCHRNEPSYGRQISLIGLPL